jgi:hypothetical protein
MYVLFEEGSDMACGVSNVIKPFTSGIYVDSVIGLEKKIKRTYWVEEKDKKGNPWYVDKNGVLTNNNKNAEPLTRNIEIEETVDVSHDPSCFSKVDVMKFKKEILLSTTKYTDGKLFEFNMDNFIDLSNSENIDMGKHDIKIRPEGIAKTNGIDIKNSKEISVLYDSENDLDTYYSFDGKMYYKCKKSIKNDSNSEVVYIGFKNSKQEDATLNAYQILFK